MVHKEIDGEPDLTFEDPDLTPQNRWRWMLPVGLLIVLPALGMYALDETGGYAFWPSHNALMRSASGEGGAVGTSGREAVNQAQTDDVVIRELETITGSSDRRPLIGRKVNLVVPVAARANDVAFWIGSADNRVLVVPRRDLRDSQLRQQGRVPSRGMALIESGATAAISGSIQQLPRAEERYSWALTNQDQREATSMDVYLSADSITVQ
jgi:hypothetical protein